MNKNALMLNEDLLKYQTLRLQELITEMLECCEDRKLYETTRFSLPHAELKCLMLFDGERYLTVKGIAKKLEVAKSRVTKIVDWLVEKRLVEQMDTPRMPESNSSALHRKGEAGQMRFASFQREIHRKILLQMDIDERKYALSYLELLRSAMEAVKEQF